MRFRTARDIGFMIRAERRAQCLSQAELAARNSTTQAWISEIENGKNTAEIGMVLRVVMDLGIELGFKTAAQVEADYAHEEEEQGYAPPYRL